MEGTLTKSARNLTGQGGTERLWSCRQISRFVSLPCGRQCSPTQAGAAEPGHFLLGKMTLVCLFPWGCHGNWGVAATVCLGLVAGRCHPIPSNPHTGSGSVGSISFQSPQDGEGRGLSAFAL